VCGLGNDDSDGGGIGDDDSEDDSLFFPQLITTLLGVRVRAIAAGPRSSCAVTDAGALYYTWGYNTYGILGHGDVLNRYRPNLVQGLQGIPIVGVSMAFKHTLATAADGSVYVFGEGFGLGISSGGEGEKMIGRTLTPQRIPNLNCMVPR
jgi:alpha-tubulin suppressor-like RCC1 family protein